MDDMSLIEREWRVMRFQNDDGKRIEVASNHVGPEAVPVPPGYRFVDSTAMVPADQLRGAVDALRTALGYLSCDESDAAAVVVEQALQSAGVDPYPTTGGQ